MTARELVTLVFGALFVGGIQGCVFVVKSDKAGMSSFHAAGEECSGLRERRKADLSRLSPDDGIPQFKAVFHEAVFVESRAVEGVRWDAYSVTHEERHEHESPKATGVCRDELWFFFEDGKYRGFGRRSAWPVGEEL